MKITDEAVEAAARADYGDGDQYETWETEPEEVREMYLNDARRILEAAAPHMLTEMYVAVPCARCGNRHEGPVVA